MAKILDKDESKFVRYGSYICVWEVYTNEWDDNSCEYVQARKAVFYDPYKAMNWAIKKFGVCATVMACLFKPEWCE